MIQRKLATYESSLPPDDDHPYRTGAWQPTHTEWEVTDCVVEGDLPDDLNGVYLRNTENPLHHSIGMYHPFDGDGMIHAVEFANGKANYRNRFTRTDGFEAEFAAGHPLWAGIAESPEKSIRRDGIGARTLLKDASSTDVVVHNGVGLSTHYQCGDVWAFDPVTLEQHGRVAWDKPVPPEGVSAHARVDYDTNELIFFNYGKQAPYMHYGVVDQNNQLIHYTDVELPGPRLPHDLAFTPNYTILNDFPLFWDPEGLKHDHHAVRFFPDLPSRFAVIPRHGSEVRWFEASPTFVLHWINAYEDGDEIVLDGFFQKNPQPAVTPDMGFYEKIFRFLDNSLMEPVPYRWRLNLATGAVKEEQLSETSSEFGMVRHNQFGKPYRYYVSAGNAPGWFLFDHLVRTDLDTGSEQVYRLPEGVFASESPIAPRDGGSAEDDAYILTYVSDLNNDRSECLVFDAADITPGPIARVKLPQRISSGTHSTWVPAAELAHGPGTNGTSR